MTYGPNALKCKCLFVSGTSVTLFTITGVTQLMWQTMNRSRKRSVTKTTTSGASSSIRTWLRRKRWSSASPPWSRTATSQDLRNVRQNTAQSAPPGRVLSQNQSQANQLSLHYRYHEHEVEEDRPYCREEQEQKCEQFTQGYTTDEKCTNWPRTRCTLETRVVKKYTPETECKKVPFELCGPSACPVEPGAEQCFDKKETVFVR